MYTIASSKNATDDIVAQTKREHKFENKKRIQKWGRYMIKDIFKCKKYVEEDGTITLSSEVLDVVENAATEREAKIELAKSILDYAKDFYEDYDYWSSAPNRKGHVPYVFKAILLNDISKIAELISC